MRNELHEVDRYTLAMTVAAFLSLFSAAALHQGAVAASGAARFDPFFIAGAVAIGTAVVTSLRARLRLRKRLVELAKQRGMSDTEANAHARDTVARCNARA